MEFFMKNHYYCDYRNNEAFLELVEEYVSEHNNDFDSIKEAIRRKVSMWINEAHGDQYDVNMYISEAKSLLNVLQHINDTIHADQD
jgi:hypothetical protein